MATRNLYIPIIAALVLVWAAFTTPQEANASCAGQRPIWIHGSQGEPLPTNAPFRLWLPGRPDIDFSDVHVIKDDWKGWDRSWSSWKEALKHDVPIRAQLHRSEDTTLAEVTPVGDWEPDTRYTIYLSKRHVKWRFTTGSSPERVPPKWSNEPEAVLVSPSVPDSNGHRPILSTDAGESWIDVFDSGYQNSNRDIALLAVYELPLKAKRIPKGAQPTAYVLWRYGRATLGRPSICGSRNFAWGGKKQLRLGVVPIDKAGNEGEARVFTIDLTSPMSRWYREQRFPITP